MGRGRVGVLSPWGEGGLGFYPHGVRDGWGEGGLRFYLHGVSEDRGSIPMG